MTFRIKTAEWVFPGHPDKIADAIADAIVAAAVEREARALVGVEVAVHMHHVILTGRVACKDADQIDFNGLVQAIYRRAGYGPDWYPAPGQLAVQNLICLGPLLEGEAELREVSDDQAICVGYAIDIPETNYLPLEQFLVQRVSIALQGLKTAHPDLLLGPDGKVIITLQDNGAEWVLKAVSCSLQQKVAGDDVVLHRAVRQTVLDLAAEFASRLKGFRLAPDCRIIVNGAGAFELGGPEGDNGLSGKKLVMDAYGPSVPIGGGAWSGKDFFKADRAGGLHARRLAKTLVRFGLAEEAIVTLGWTPGEARAEPLSIQTNTGLLDVRHPVVQATNLSLLRSGATDLSAETIRALPTSGHFSGPDLWWEESPII
jgi:S-adenosylmethionine synthetase